MPPSLARVRSARLQPGPVPQRACRARLATAVPRPQTCVTRRQWAGAARSRTWLRTCVAFPRTCVVAGRMGVAFPRTWVVAGRISLACPGIVAAGRMGVVCPRVGGECLRIWLRTRVEGQRIWPRTSPRIRVVRLRVRQAARRGMRGSLRLSGWGGRGWGTVTVRPRPSAALRPRARVAARPVPQAARRGLLASLRPARRVDSGLTCMIGRTGSRPH
jgi:hypothetical protein